MGQLSGRRKLFHSEADFQHELAWQIKVNHPNLGIRVERPFAISRGRGAIDILVLDQDRSTAIELKYVRSPLKIEVAGETYDLKRHIVTKSAYDCCKDLQRLESFVRAGGACQGFLVVLTNHKPFWTKGSKGIPEHFALWEGNVLTGHLDWTKDTKTFMKHNRKTPIELSGTYNTAWSDYSSFDTKNGQFRYCVIRVG